MLAPVAVCPSHRNLLFIKGGIALSGRLAVNMVGIHKQFGEVVANDSVDFQLKEGELHCLLGENGAGKTTLMHLLYGQMIPDKGEILIKEKKVHLHSSSDAINHKIGMVSQHFSLIPTLTVSENMMIRKFPKKNLFLIDKKKMHEQTQVLAQDLGFHLNPREKVENLSIGEQQLVEIMKALYQGSEILILDEPTALLTPQENEKLFEMIRSMTGKGFSVVIITHKLDEALKCDRATVMRGGRNTATYEISQTSKQELTEAMFGKRELSAKAKVSNLEIKPELLMEIKDLQIHGAKKSSSLKGINFDIRSGEIFGIAGIAGNGQTELVEALTGFSAIDQGGIFLEGKGIHNLSPLELRAMKIRYIPENRIKRGMLGDTSLAENILLGNEGRSPFSTRGIVDYNHLYEMSEELLTEYNVKASGIHAHAKTLSGGNIQKVILAREFSAEPKIIIAHEPLRGLDLITIDFIRQKLREQASRGTAVVYVATDYEEVLHIADRIAVMYNGRLKILSNEEMSMQYLGRYIAGDWENG
jgi:ABC-type uncharacterized transport system ATPase subunit